MNTGLSLYIALRYLRAKRRHHFISFISVVSVIGIALGVAALITVISVMNGFDEQIRQRLFGMARHIQVIDPIEAIYHWPDVAANLRQQHPGVVDIAPYIDDYGILTSDVGGVHPIAIVGILPEVESRVSVLSENMQQGSLDSLQPSVFNIVIGQQLAQNLGVNLGDKVVLMIPQATVTPAALLPRFRRFEVSGIFSVGNGFGFDNQLAFIALSDAQKLFQKGEGVTGLRLKVDNLYQSTRIAKQIRQQLPGIYQVRDWTQDYGALFESMKLERIIMYVILSLIIAVAAFNLISSLMMMVNNKRAEIAILRTLGETPAGILKIFILQGMLIGLVGIVIGFIGGLLLAWKVTDIVNYVEALLGSQLLSSNIYFVNYIPSKILPLDLVYIGFIALSLSFLSTIYPAWRAAKTQPAEALRYE
jgi:lipoprotein-releasing system permease protein